MGGTLSAGTIAGMLGGCTARPGDQARTLTGRQSELVATIAERIIPETDTPGARAAGVHTFIDAMLTDWYGEEERAHFLSELATADERARAMFAKEFLNLDAAQQVQLLTTLEDEALAAMPTQDRDRPPLFIAMKTLTLFGYYTSEIGATIELRVMPMGEYRGDVPFEEIGRAWA